MVSSVGTLLIYLISSNYLMFFDLKVYNSGVESGEVLMMGSTPTS